MDKDTLLKELANKIASGEISREEVSAQFGLQTSKAGKHSTKDSHRHYFSLINILYALGGVILLAGIIVLFSQIWLLIGSSGRIAVTLGLGIILSLSGLMISKVNKYLEFIFQFIAGLLIPIGAMVSLFELGGDLQTVLSWQGVFTFSLVFIYYLILYQINPNSLLAFFSIQNGSFLFYITTFTIAKDDLTINLYVYTIMTMSIAYYLLAQAFNRKWHKFVINYLYLISAVGFLGAAFSRIGDIVWQIAYVFIILGFFYLAVLAKNKIILWTSAVFSFAYLIYITREYFSGLIGWPLALLILGFLLLTIGYLSAKISQKYIKNKTAS